ncbi:fimbria/pilus outer membrane usher protein [Serratia fonticola]|uniref:fimbria/pilus outer membrane usher protein n=1 Tax=Serratia fonticola TaxID=47917 RepID=UPI0005607712|nr:fimbria/pilus outer membrane usher protein [Serratia fonticola]
MAEIKPRWNPIYLFLFLAGCTGSAFADDYFDPSLLSLGDSSSSSDIDLSQFSTAGYVPAGHYLVDIYLNQQRIGSNDIVFAKENGSNKVLAELTPRMLEDWGVNVTASATLKDLPKNRPVGDLGLLIPQASVTMNLAKLRLDLSIPQVALKPNITGYVDPTLWDQGIPAFLMNYNLSGSRSWLDGYSGGDKSRNQSLFVNLHSGLNWGAWRLRSDMTHNRSEATGNSSWGDSSFQETEFLNTYLQRDIQTLRAQLTMGDISSGGDIFDSMPFRGVQLSSNDDMLPDSQRGFAPVIAGIASSNARVTVSQHGNVIYQTYVPPGPFKLTDVYQASSGGDLTITIVEADGSQRTSTQAYSALPIMQRPGKMNFELAAGRYRSGGMTEGNQQPTFGMGTLIYGLPYNITLYGGGLLASNYQASVLGTSFSLGYLGAVSADMTLSRAFLPGEDRPARGSSYRLKYSKSMLATGTSVDLTAYRYSTDSYYSFSDVNSMGFRLNDDIIPWARERRRSTWQMQLSQQLSSWGSLYFSAVRDSYWGNSHVNTSLSSGFSGNLAGIGYSLSYSIDRIKGDGDWPENRQVALNVQLPLSLLGGSDAFGNAYASYNTSRDNDGKTSHQGGISGSILEGRFNYNVMQGGGQGQANSGSASLGYQGGNGNLNLGYNYSDSSRSVNFGLAGGVLAHPYGVTLSQTMGDSVALVRAPGVADLKVSGRTQTNRWGYAVVPYLSNYQSNTISVDPSSLEEGTDVNNTSVNVYPTGGAVVLANYHTRIGQQVLMTLIYHGKPVPFGAMASLQGDEDSASIVGDGGQVYLNGLPENGEIQVKWGNGSHSQCKVAFKLGEPVVLNIDAGFTPMKQITAHCE